MMTVSRILFSGDFLRVCDHAPEESESLRRIRWFEDLLSPALALVTGLPTGRLAAESRGDLSSLYADQGCQPSVDAWAELFAGDLSPQLEQRIVDRCQGALVLSIELPPAVAALLDRSGIPFIDCTVDSLRFLNDIPLGFRSPDSAVRAALEPFRVSTFDIRRRVGQIRAKSRWLAPLSLPEGLTLILGQVATDGALIDPRRRRRVSWDDYLDALWSLRARGGPIWWRPHPFESQNSALAGVLGTATETHENIYRLLAHDHLRHVMAISSGAVVEARAFGKEGTHLLNRHAGVALNGWSSPVPVLGHWLSPHFWSTVLKPLVPTRDDVPVLDVEGNAHRKAVNCDWGFGWIDQVVAA